MKHHLKYKSLVLFAAVILALAFTSCSADLAADSAVDAQNENSESSMNDENATQPEMNDSTDDTMQEDDNTMDDDNMTDDEESMDSEDGQKVFTLEELAQYDGKDGRKAYVAVDGVVYDVSDKSLWAGGEHQNRVSAGLDLSEEILQSPHGKAKLKELPVVGVLAEE